jgi:signal transduction histidine kinase
MTVIDRYFLRRTARLQAGVRHIAETGNWSARVPVAGHDELTELARSINGLLAALEQAQRENARLIQDTQRQIDSLSLIHTTVMAAARSTSLDAALQVIAHSAQAALQASSTLVVLREPPGMELHIRASAGVSFEALTTRSIKEGEGIIGAAAQSGNAILINDVARDPRYQQMDARTQSGLCVPIKVGERVIGLINVESDRLNAFTPADGQQLQALAHDLSPIVDRMQTLEELRAANAQLAEQDRLRDRFVIQLSHELRAPLNAILGFNEVLIDGATGALTDEQREYLHYIAISGQHLLALINDILDLSLLQAQRMLLEQRALPFADIVAEARTIVWPAVQRKHQRLVIEVPPDLPDPYVDPLRVKQILINLLNNACKFTPPGGRLALRVERWEESWLRISVSDTGPGIPRDRQTEVFEDFSQLDRQQRDLDRGTGLGLSIARRLVELHGGQIWIDSTGLPGEGTTFHFTLPLNDTAAALQEAGT